jgi:hypothetical protein
MQHGGGDLPLRDWIAQVISQQGSQGGGAD